MMSLVFTGTAQPASLALAENFLYTREAFALYLNRLKPGGMLAILDDSPHRCLRQAATALAALQARGMNYQEALSRIAVIRDPAGQTGYQYLLMVVPSGPAAELWAAARAESRRRKLTPQFLAGAPPAPPYDELAARGLAAFLADSPIELGAPSDDTPFFFDFTKGPARLAPLLPLLVLGGASLAAALAFARRGGRPAADRRRFALAALVGCAFMLVESALLQRLTLAAGTPAAILSTLLFSLLFWCALGGPVGRRLSGGEPSLRGALALAAAAGALAALALPQVYALASIRGAGPRTAALFFLLSPIGLALGRPFPALLRSAATDEDRAALWGVNGLASVGGASLALCASFLFGADAALWLGAALYAAGAVISSSEKAL